MKKQKVFVFTELYGNESDTEVNVLGVYTTKTKAKEKLAAKNRRCWNHTSKPLAVSMRFLRTIQPSSKLPSRTSIFGSSY